MNRSTIVELTNLCMIYDGNGNVLVEDKITPTGHGLILPGGHIESGESIVDSVIREMKEETGLTVSNLTFCGIKDWIEENGARYMVFLYKTNSFEGTIRSSEEGCVYWMPLRELMQRTDALWNLHEMLDILCGTTFSELFFDEGSDMQDPILL